MFNRKKKRKALITAVAVDAYNVGIEDVLEILELQMFEHGDLADLRDMVKLIEKHRDSVFEEIFGE